MLSPHVSVAVITYNQQDFVEQTLLSALEQDYDNLQVVVSDDNSLDSTPTIIRALAGKYPGRLLPLLNNKRAGITPNTNRALSECKGEFVAFLGGDDLFNPGKIARQVEYMQSHPGVVLSYHDVDLFDSVSGSSLYHWSQRYGKRSGDARSVVRYGTYMCGTSVMVRKKELPAAGCDERIRAASDWLLWVEALAQSGGRVGYIDETLARYRRSPGSVTRSWGWKFEDQNLTLAIIEARWPEYTTQVRMRRSELYFIQSLRSAMLRRWGAAWHLAWGASLSSFPSSPWLRLLARELAFYFRRRRRRDDLLASLGAEE